jgi:ABC-2 type transport system ATP-binding protein
VAKRFEEVTALAGVSFEVHERACFGLLGPNGAGKSTLIRSIVGRVRPDSGNICVFGHPANSAAARAAMGWVPQELALYWLLTCRENLQAFGRYHGLRGKPLREAIQWCLEWAGLADRADTTVKTLSGGMRRRLNLAAGLIHRPRIVLLDEPTAGVDPQSRNRIFEMVEGLRQQGTTVIYTTHYMEEAERLCDRIAILDHGRVIAQGTKEELVAQSFGGRSDVLMRFPSAQPGAAEWALSQGGTLEEGVAHFSLTRPADIAPLLEAAGAAHLELIDVTLRRPNLESVFLQLTGRDLRP